MGLVLATPPAVEPVTFADIAQMHRLDDDFEQGLVETMIKAARKTIEAAQNRQLITAEYEWSFDYWPCANGFTLPISPVQSVDAIKYYDTAGTQQTWASSNYQVSLTDVLATVTLETSATFPVLEQDKVNAVTVEFTAGYGDAASDVPENTRLAIMALVGHWFENRIPVAQGAQQEVPMHIQHMLTPESVPLAY